MTQARPPAVDRRPTPGEPRATDRGLRLLRAVADAPGGASLAELARAVDLSPSTALRQLRALESSGFVSRDPDGAFTPGPELLRIARNLAPLSSLAALAAPVLERLAAATGESCYLVEPLDRRRAVYRAAAEGHHAIRHVSWLGNEVSRRGTAAGAALAGDVDADGVAVRVDAVEPGITALSSPLVDRLGHVIGALSVVGPTFRLAGERLSLARAALAESTRVLGSGLLGH